MSTEPEFVQKIIDMYSSGIEQKEITERTGQTYCVVRYWLKKKGLYDPNRRQTGTVHAMQGLDPHNQANEARKQDAENRLAQYLLDKGFSYLGGYDGKYSTFQVACQKCGGVFSQYYDSPFLKRKNITCPCCRKKQRVAQQVEKEAKWEKKRLDKALKEKERQAKLNKHFDEPHICPICNKTFTIREYAESLDLDPICISNVEYCSDKCRRKGHGANRHIKRAKLHGCEWETGVTLKQLIKRDGLRCAICGEMCDINDRSWGNGTGPRYPSMDHIIPIAKGGNHTWDNVQVAHLICNSDKSAKTLDNVKFT